MNEIAVGILRRHQPAEVGGQVVCRRDGHAFPCRTQQALAPRVYLRVVGEEIVRRAS